MILGVNVCVNMHLTTIRAGQKFTVFAVDLSDDPTIEECPAKGFLDGLEPDAHRSFTAVLTLHADHGPIKNPSKSVELEDGIFEFKVDKGPGWRLYYFYQPPIRPGGPGTTVLTHGGPKRKRLQLRTEIETAQSYRNIVQGG